MENKNIDEKPVDSVSSSIITEEEIHIEEKPKKRLKRKKKNKVLQKENVNLPKKDENLPEEIKSEILPIDNEDLKELETSLNEPIIVSTKLPTKSVLIKEYLEICTSKGITPIKPYKLNKNTKKDEIFKLIQNMKNNVVINNEKIYTTDITPLENIDYTKQLPTQIGAEMMFHANICIAEFSNAIAQQNGVDMSGYVKKTYDEQKIITKEYEMLLKVYPSINEYLRPEYAIGLRHTFNMIKGVKLMDKKNIEQVSNTPMANENIISNRITNNTIKIPQNQSINRTNTQNFTINNSTAYMDDLIRNRNK